MATENESSTHLDGMFFLNSGKATKEQAQKIIAELEEQHERMDRVWDSVATNISQQNRLVSDFLTSKGDHFKAQYTEVNGGMIETVNYRIYTPESEEVPIIRVNNTLLKRNNGSFAVIDAMQMVDFDQNSLAINQPAQKLFKFSCDDGSELEYLTHERRYCVIGSVKKGYAKAVFPDSPNNGVVFTMEVDPTGGERAIGYFQKKITKALKNPETRIVRIDKDSNYY